MRIVSWYYKVGIDSPKSLYIGKVVRANSRLGMIRYIMEPVLHFKKGALYSIDLSVLVDDDPAGDSSFEDINAATHLKPLVFNYSQFKIGDKKKLLTNGRIISYNYKGLVYKFDAIRTLQLDDEHFSLTRFLVPITPFSSMDKQKAFNLYRESQLTEIKGGK